MLINDKEQYSAIWNRVYTELGFDPSCDYRGHSLRVPLPFKLEESYAIYGCDDMTDDQIDLVPEIMKKIFVETTNEGQRMYALDWHHEAYLYDPRHPEEPKIGFIPDGDYYFFIEENFAFGYLGHPWREEVWVYGARLIEKIEEVYEQFGWTKVK